MPGVRYHVNDMESNGLSLWNVANNFIASPEFKNMYGEIINVIIGSKIIVEGISLQNVQDIHILTPHWNFTVTEQALARAIRAFSHNKLEEKGNVVTVDIYLHTTIPSIVQKGEYIPSIDDSIDLKMYERSEDKDISIKRVEQVIKESSIDCLVHSKSNSKENIKC